MKKLPVMIFSLFALACSLAPARPVYAGGGTEMVIDDDLTVLGTGGSWGDADFKVAGLTVFGSTVGLVSRMGPNPSPGSVIIRGSLQVGGEISQPERSAMKPLNNPASAAGVIAVNSDGSAVSPAKIRRGSRQVRRAAKGRPGPAVAVSSGTLKN